MAAISRAANSGRAASAAWSSSGESTAIPSAFSAARISSISCRAAGDSGSAAAMLATCSGVAPSFSA